MLRLIPIVCLVLLLNRQWIGMWMVLEALYTVFYRGVSERWGGEAEKRERVGESEGSVLIRGTHGNKGVSYCLVPLLTWELWVPFIDMGPPYTIRAKAREFADGLAVLDNKYWWCDHRL